MTQRVKIGGWRKIAAATWRSPRDPQIYGDFDVDAGALLQFIDDARAAGARLTVTHLVGKAVALALAEHPDLNVRLYRSHFVRRETADVFSSCRRAKATSYPASRSSAPTRSRSSKLLGS